RVAEGTQALRHAVAVIALDLDDGALHRAARAAEPSELAGPRVQGRPAFGHAVDHRHDLPAASATVPCDPYDAVVGKTSAPRDGAPRCRATRIRVLEWASLGGIDEPAIRHAASVAGFPRRAGPV